MESKGGRPSAFRPEFVEQARKLARIGAIDRQIAEFFDVSVRTIHYWKIDHPEFAEALKLGKEQADDLVEQSLFRKATGYSFDAVKIMSYEGDPIVVDYVEHVPPSDQAAMFWLKNRRPEQWKDKVDHQHSGQIVMNVTPDDERL